MKHTWEVYQELQWLSIFHPKYIFDETIHILHQVFHQGMVQSNIIDTKKRRHYILISDTYSHVSINLMHGYKKQREKKIILTFSGVSTRNLLNPRSETSSYSS